MVWAKLLDEVSGGFESIFGQKKLLRLRREDSRIDVPAKSFVLFLRATDLFFWLPIFSPMFFGLFLFACEFAWKKSWSHSLDNPQEWCIKKLAMILILAGLSTIYFFFSIEHFYILFSDKILEANSRNKMIYSTKRTQKLDS